ncbi:MAG TPA: ABC transporter permease, partial [Acetobacteraceae bacterium]|nr:ABC transporter permease [Acetobacteraceae bacterium]
MSGTTLATRMRQIQYYWSPRQTFADLFAKPWMEPAIPCVVLLALLVGFAFAVPNYASIYNAQTMGRAFAEFGFVAIAMGLSLISGGIDLSVGSIFALADFTALMAFDIWGLPVPLVALITVLAGGLLGAVNGFFIGVLRTRAFLSTLVTLIVYRAVFDLLTLQWSGDLAMASASSDAWDMLGNGGALGVPSDVWGLLIVVICGHILLSRSRLGWHLMAVGASRRSARHAGISIPQVLFSTYVVTGMLTALGAVFFAARLASVGSQTGDGYAFQALAAVMIGGVSLSGGKGTIGRCLIGAGIIFVLGNGLVQFGYPGQVTNAVNGAILLLAI